MVSGLMFLMAVVLLFAGTVGGTQAALQVRSNNYYSAFDLDHIGVTLYENGQRVAYRNYGAEVESGFTESQNGRLTLNDLSGDKDFHLGKNYPFVITAQNTGTIAQYVRVTIYKYWVAIGDKEERHANGWLHGTASSKYMDSLYDPALIELSYSGGAYNGTNWVKDTSSSTPEREIYYYIGPLNPTEVSKALFTDLRVSSAVARLVNMTRNGNMTIYTYAYDGMGFVVEASVDAIQTHHARAAITSAWGTGSSVMDQMGIPNS